jgi:translin
LNLNQFETILGDCRAVLEAKNVAREKILALSRTLVRQCANAIRAMHRQEWDAAHALLDEARATKTTMREASRTDPELYHAGYTQDAFKEYVEAYGVLAILRAEPLPAPADLDVEISTYLNGLTEAASELRRYILDTLRAGQAAEAERLLAAMDVIYDGMATIDFPEAISGGLRHRLDGLRGVLERTRGDITP